MSRSDRKAIIARTRPGLSLGRQCRLLSISRSSYYYAPKGESPDNLALMRRIDELFLKYPFYGSRQMVRQLRREGVCVGRHRIRRLMRLMGLEAIYQTLLKALAIDRPKVWCADITYIPVSRGNLIPGRDHGLGDTLRSVVAAVETPLTPGSASRPWLRRWPDTPTA